MLQLIILLMLKFIGLLFLIAISSSFKIDFFKKAETQVQAVNWPFSVCGKGSWTPNSLTLQQTPARNNNNSITLVSSLLFRLDKQTITLSSFEPTLM